MQLRSGKTTAPTTPQCEPAPEIDMTEPAPATLPMHWTMPNSPEMEALRAAAAEQAAEK